MSCPRGCCASYREHLQSITIHGPSARRSAARQEEADMHAYKRLVQSGVQPSRIEGAAALERGAESAREVEHRRILTDRQTRKRVDAAFSEAASVPAVTPLSAEG